MSPFYTRGGDDGSTGVLGEGRVKKSDLRIEALGTLDELTAALGLARSLCEQPLANEIMLIQTTVYQAMAEVAATPQTISQFQTIGAEVILDLESRINGFALKVELPKGFILPGDTTASAALSMARTIARRAERRLVELGERETTISTQLIAYFNRLSSFLYVLELFAIQKQAGKTLTLAKNQTL